MTPDNTKKGSWIVRMTCQVTKEVILEDCTEAEAWNDPWEHAVDERELDQYDWDVTRVTPNV